MSYRPRKDFLSLSDKSGPPFYDIVEPARFPATILRYRNDEAAKTIGLDTFSDDTWINRLATFAPLPDNFEAPVAIRYHGHQFRTYNPDIGDGRGFLFAQVEDDNGRLLDLGTKGSGTTPYSRSGDGRLTLKGAVREILATEMLQSLGVNTSKTLSVIETGERLYRQDEPSPTRSAVLVRLGHSHIRFGVFQRLAFEGNADAIQLLTDYCIDRYFPSLAALPAQDKVPAFFQQVIERTTSMTAQWMAAGFVHGVLNTDNMNVTGESFDYGPWRFLPTVDFGFTAAYFDHTGLYSYGRQPEASAWNLSRLGGALALIADEKPLNEALETFGPSFEKGMANAFANRLGVVSIGQSDSEAYAFAGDILRWLEESKVPFQQFFFDWFTADGGRASSSPYQAHYADKGFEPIKEKLAGVEPVEVTDSQRVFLEQRSPEDMLIEEVESLWEPIAQADDWSPLEAKLRRVRHMGVGYGNRD
ncbi:MAG: YdiU family protein, partial [Pseudomonadota bacterium]